MTAAISILRELLANSEGTRDTYDLGTEMRGRIKAALDAHDATRAVPDAEGGADTTWLNLRVRLIRNGSDWDTAKLALESLERVSCQLTVRGAAPVDAYIRSVRRIVQARRFGHVEDIGGFAYVRMDEHGDAVGEELFARYEDIEDVLVH